MKSAAVVSMVVGVLIAAGLAPTAASAPLEVSPNPAQAERAITNGSLATNAQIITPSGEQRVAPWSAEHIGTFSPDGASIVYVNHRILQGRDDISLRVQDAGGEAREIWSDVGLQIFQPQWSPDGSILALATEPFGIDGGKTRLWLVDPSGAAEPVEVMKGRSGEFRAVAWSPDGSSLAYVRGSRDVFRYELATETTTQLTQQCTWSSLESPGDSRQCRRGTRNYEGLDWSPTGDEIVVGDRDRPLVINAQSGEPVRSLPAPPGRSFLSTVLYSPDGTQIAYGGSNPKGLFTFVAPAEGGTAQQVANSFVSSWQACDGTCPTFGTPRKKSRVSASTSNVGRRVEVSGQLLPVTEFGGPGDRVTIAVQLRKAGRWKTTATKDAHVYEGFTVRLPRPSGDSCRAMLTYPGGWYLTAGSAKVAVSC